MSKTLEELIDEGRRLWADWSTIKEECIFACLSRDAAQKAMHDAFYNRAVHVANGEATASDVPCRTALSEFRRWQELASRLNEQEGAAERDFCTNRAAISRAQRERLGE